MKSAGLENSVILIVEDDPLIRSVVKTMCELWDYKVVTMEDGYKASAYLEQNPLPEPVPTFALLDIRMPGPWGHEIGKKIRQHPQLKDIGIVMMTAYELRRAEEEDVFKTSGADRILYKPLPAMDELHKLFKEVLAARRAPTEKTEAAASSEKTGEPTKDIHLSVFYPQEVQIGKRYRTSVYVHLESALADVKEDLEADEPTEGIPVSPDAQAKPSSRIKIGTPVTIIPGCSGLEFSPNHLTKKWEEDWVRFHFDFKSKLDQQTGTVQAQVILQVAGIEIGRVDFAIHIVKPEEVPPAEKKEKAKPSPRKPLGLKTQPIYKKVFISYSRSDKPVVEAVRKAKQGLGEEMFADTYTVRTSGTKWQTTLAKAIDEADILQLFWSKEAASSVGIRAEWTYALQQRCPKTRCRNFIRPVYWQRPIPEKPARELAHLSFRYVSLDRGGE
jgi:CheY-like chemotaxis protein